MVGLEEGVEKLKSYLGAENILDVKFQPPRNCFILISSNKLKDAVSYMVNELNCKYLITITGVDLIKDNQFELFYHLNDGVNTFSLRIRVPRDNPNLVSIVDIIPGAVFYEREIYELFGVIFEGNPRKENFILSDGWPVDVFPLRKDWSVEKIRGRLEEERKKGVKGI
ncbi:MAG: NADH-quinone oxidoreductase subunit C [Candidatus Bathyarchaeota archaeon]|nr:NADH-quinone oxidoreductase subunit C [Candidatus Bathyarchaeota archaeon]